ncbi:hypothetical protein LX36DRAFT_197212 [Colletotrichum falcatum]|nr:hypothetical protein LX36DRAFT_197212 [Colletotrichum falcatum]
MRVSTVILPRDPHLDSLIGKGRRRRVRQGRKPSVAGGRCKGREGSKHTHTHTHTHTEQDQAARKGRSRGRQACLTKQKQRQQQRRQQQTAPAALGVQMRCCGSAGIAHPCPCLPLPASVSCLLTSLLAASLWSGPSWWLRLTRTYLVSHLLRLPRLPRYEYLPCFSIRGCRRSPSCFLPFPSSKLLFVAATSSLTSRRPPGHAWVDE